MEDTKEQLIKEKESIKAQKTRKVTKLREKGITLIALVVTIIILLILTGVTLNMALSDNGLFKKAKEAVEKYEKAQEDEEEAIRQITTQMYSEYVGAKVTGYEPEKKTSDSPCTIGGNTSGTGSDQTFTTDDNMSWRVWDFDGNILRIVGDPTTTQLTLKGVAGYNNGVWAIEKICNDCYSNGRKGVTVTSLKRSDIQKVSSYDYTQYKHKENDWKEEVGDSETGGLVYFGESKTYNTNNRYPKMWNDNDANWTYGYDNTNKEKTGSDQECKTWENVGKGKGEIQETEMTQGSTETTFKQSYYYHNYNKEEFPNQKYYDLIFKRSDNTNVGPYWLAGRYVQLYDIGCNFGLSYVGADNGGNYVTGFDLCRSRVTDTGAPGLVRPIVSIDLRSSGCRLEVVDEKNGDVTECELSWPKE